MKLALVTVAPPGKWPLKEWVYPHLGLGYLASYIRKFRDVNVVIIDGICGEKVTEVVRKEKPDVIGITCTTLEFSEAKKLGSEIRSRYGVPIIMGGVHISALPYLLPKCFNIGVIGEGERTLLDLVELYSRQNGFPPTELKKIKGICFHKGNRVVVTNDRDLIRPLDVIPYPARELFRMEKYYLKPQMHFPGGFGRGTSIISSRGCPYRCIFCHSSRFWKIVRFHSPEYVVGEIRHLIDRYRVRYVNIFDDIFNLSRKRVKAIVSIIEEEKIKEKVAFGIQARADLVDIEMCKLLKKMGVIYIGFGLESGSDKILSFLKKGTITVEDNRRAVKLAKQFGFYVGSGFMIGNPGEIVEDLELTRKFIMENPLDVVNLYITAPLPGSELWDYAESEGLVSKDIEWSRIDQFFHGNNVILNLQMGKDQFIEMYNKLKRTCRSKRKAIRNALIGVINDPRTLPELLHHPYHALRLMRRQLT